MTQLVGLIFGIQALRDFLGDNVTLRVSGR